jgi:AcrR family transcriptional regulator
MSEFESTDFPRSAQTTRERIISAAAAHFARKPLRNVPLKEIANDAGVSAPLIIKYFGSKEGLISELIDFSQFVGAINQTEFSKLGYQMANSVLTGYGLNGQSMIPLIISSLDSQETADIIAKRFDEAIANDLIRRIHEESPEEISRETAVYRAQMAVALCAGYLVLSHSRMIDESNAPQIPVETLGKTIQQIIEHG